MNNENINSKIRYIQKQFLCGLPISEINWLNIFDNVECEILENLIEATINFDLNLRQPLLVSYQIAFVKSIITHLEKHGIDTHDCIYEAFGRLLMLPMKQTCFKHFIIENDQIISLLHIPFILSGGTTGLFIWEASLALAEWCLVHKDLFKNKVILELGSGAGLTGVTIASKCEPKKVYVSDCHVSVLKILHDNLKLNAKAIHSDQIDVIKLDWEDITEDDCNDLNPDLLLASDVIYDSTLFPSLINAVSIFLKLNKEKEFIIACTERNRDTLEQFLMQLGSAKLVYKELELASQNNFMWSTSSPIRIFSIRIQNSV